MIEKVEFECDTPAPTMFNTTNPGSLPSIAINTRVFIYLIILLSGVVTTLSLKLVGGLLVYALLFNPASSALQFLEDMRKVVVVSPIIGVVTNLLGLIASLFLDLPVGSCIVLVSTLVFAVAVIVSPRRRRSIASKGQ